MYVKEKSFFVCTIYDVSSVEEIRLPFSYIFPFIYVAGFRRIIENTKKQTFDRITRLYFASQSGSGDGLFSAELQQ